MSRAYVYYAAAQMRHGNEYPANLEAEVTSWQSR